MWGWLPPRKELTGAKSELDGTMTELEAIAWSRKGIRTPGKACKHQKNAYMYTSSVCVSDSDLFEGCGYVTKVQKRKHIHYSFPLGVREMDSHEGFGK